MTAAGPGELAVGDVVRLRRAHPCGTDRMVVTMLGVDVRMSCQGCGSRVLVDRQRLGRRVAEVMGRAAPPGGAGGAGR